VNLYIYIYIYSRFIILVLLLLFFLSQCPIIQAGWNHHVTRQAHRAWQSPKSKLVGICTLYYLSPSLWVTCCVGTTTLTNHKHISQNSTSPFTTKRFFFFFFSPFFFSFSLLLLQSTSNDDVFLFCRFLSDALTLWVTWPPQLVKRVPSYQLSRGP
jgi:hypothetical protein